jgi:hypothetical protein
VSGTRGATGSGRAATAALTALSAPSTLPPVSVVGANCRSIGHSTLTGPPTASTASAAARRSTGAASSASVMVNAARETASSMPFWSRVSWMNPRPEPRYRLWIWPVTCSTEVAELNDSISDPAALPAPVPVLVSAHPRVPLARA